MTDQQICHYIQLIFCKLCLVFLKYILWVLCFLFYQTLISSYLPIILMGPFELLQRLFDCCRNWLKQLINHYIN